MTNQITPHQETQDSIPQWLAAKAPIETDKKSLSQILSQENLEISSRHVDIASKGKTYSVLEIKAQPNANLEKARKRLMQLFTPATESMIAEWMVRLEARGLAVKKSFDEMNELKIEEYHKELSKFPADVVKQAMLETNWQKWFPSTDDIKAVCSPLVSYRDSIIKSIDGLLEPEIPAIEVDNETPKDDASKKRANDLVKNLFKRIEG